MTRTSLRRYIRRVRWAPAAIVLSLGAACTPVVEVQLPDREGVRFGIFNIVTLDDSLLIAGTPAELALDLNTGLGFFELHYLLFDATGEELQIPSGRLEAYDGNSPRLLPPFAAAYTLRSEAVDDETREWTPVTALPKELEDFRLPPADQEQCLARSHCFEGELCRSSCPDISPAPPMTPRPPFSPQILSSDPRCAADGWPQVPAGDEIFFVDPLAAPGGNGTRANPGNSISAARFLRARTIALRRGNYPPEVIYISGDQVSFIGGCIGETRVELDLSADSGASISFRDLTLELTASVENQAAILVEDAEVEVPRLLASQGGATFSGVRATFGEVDLLGASLAIQDAVVTASSMSALADESEISIERAQFQGGAFHAMDSQVSITDVELDAELRWFSGSRSTFSVTRFLGRGALIEIFLVFDAPLFELTDVALEGNVAPLDRSGIGETRMERVSLAASDPSSGFWIASSNIVISDLSVTARLGLRLLPVQTLEVDRLDVNADVALGTVSTALQVQGYPAHLRELRLRGALSGMIARGTITADNFDISAAETGLDLILSGTQQEFRNGSIVSGHNAAFFRGDGPIKLSDLFQRVAVIGAIEYAE